MGLFSNKVDKSQIRPGDHVYAYRFLHGYSHHGIYVGADRVIHYTRTQAAKGISATSRKAKCRYCGHQPDKARGVIKTCVVCFLNGHRLFRYEYGVPFLHFVLKNSGTCTTGLSSSADTVIARATELLNKEQGFGEYDLLNNNCESFAFFCKTGKRMSVQAYTFVLGKCPSYWKLHEGEKWSRSYGSDGRPNPLWKRCIGALFQPIINPPNLETVERKLYIKCKQILSRNKQTKNEKNPCYIEVINTTDHEVPPLAITGIQPNIASKSEKKKILPSSIMPQLKSTPTK